ncbi:hypothetical protein J0H33_07975 [bacterium]|nr:hypothetical protein [bacterium]
MTEPLQVSQFAIVNRDPVDRGPNAGVFLGKGPADDHAELVIVAEGTTPAGEAFAAHVVSALGSLFTGLDMSLTGSIGRIVDEAARNVADWNDKSIAQHRVNIGLTCFARRGAQAVLAQAGPSAAFHVQGSNVTAYYTDEQHGRPIGAGEPSAQLTRIDFQPGDKMLLISTAVLRELDDEVMEGILRLPAGQILPNIYHRILADIRYVTAVLVRTDGAANAALPESDFVIGGAQAPTTASADAHEADGDDASRPSESNFQPSLFIESRPAQLSAEEARSRLLAVVPRRHPIEPVETAVVAEMPAPLLRVAGGDVALSRLAAERRSHAQRMHAANAAARYPVIHAPGMGSVIQVPEPRRRHSRRDSFSRGLVHDDAPPPPVDPVVESMPRVTEMAANRRAESVAVIAPVTGDVIAGETAQSLSSGGSLVRLRANMGGRWKGGGVLSRGGTLAGSLPPTWLVILVGLGLLIGLVGVLTIPKLMNKQSSEHYTQLVSGAEQRLSAAQVEQNPAQKRTDLTEAQAMLIEAGGMSNAGPEVQTYLQQAKAAIATMDAVRAPAAISMIGSLDQFGPKPVSAVDLAVGATEAYILDGASNQVIAMALAGGKPSVVYVADAAKKHGNPIATAILDPGGTAAPSLLIADAANALWSYSPESGLHQIAFSAPPGLHLTDIATHGSDLYVLDASQNTIYQFVPSDGGYSAAPTIALQTPDLAAARRLAVGDDVVTSDAGGTLHRFTGKVALSLSQAGIDAKLAGAASPVTLSDGDIGILDAPNNRIVAFRRDGAFDYQYRSDQFQASTAFTISNGVGYVYANAQLKKVTFSK